MGTAHRPAPLRRHRAARRSCSPCSSFPCSASRSGRGRASSRWRQTGPRYDALQTLTDGGVGAGVLTPIEVLVPAGDAEAAAEAARGVDGVQLAVVGTTVGDSAVVDVLPDRRHPRQRRLRRGRRRQGGGRARRRRRRRDHRSRGDRRGLLQRGLRQVPLRAGADLPDHLRPAGPHLPVRAPAAQGGAAQPDLPRGRVRLHRVLLAAGPRGRRDLRRRPPPAPSTSGCPW